MPLNQIQGRLDINDEQQLKTMINDIEDLVPWLVNLTPAERKSYVKLGKQSYRFIDEVAEIAKERPELFPSFLDKTDFLKIVSSFDVLSHLRMKLISLSEAVDDNTMAFGEMAMRNGLAVYRNVKDASQHNVKGTNELAAMLAKRFDYTGTSNFPQDDVDVDETSDESEDQN